MGVRERVDPEFCVSDEEREFCNNVVFGAAKTPRADDPCDRSVSAHLLHSLSLTGMLSCIVCNNVVFGAAKTPRADDPCDRSVSAHLLHSLSLTGMLSCIVCNNVVFGAAKTPRADDPCDRSVSAHLLHSLSLTVMLSCTTLCFKSKTLQELEVTTFIELNSCIQYFSEINLETNQSKSNVVHFCLKQNELSERPAVFVDDVLLEETYSTKFQGCSLTED
ncbi:hypothetical protein J6590_042208 [Homalodisca vitripennis]|nr:hypothetical protein J6590_042208 [Homalodisca vitripennis]